MRNIVTTTFVTLDGVMQSPGRSDEDRDEGFEYGGWIDPYGDKVTSEVMNGFMGLPFELLLGRRTYDIFASYWPNTKAAPIIANKFNSTRKYVVSKHPARLSWHNSTLITGDVVMEIQKLKGMNDADLWVYGSGQNSSKRYSAMG